MSVAFFVVIFVCGLTCEPRAVYLRRGGGGEVYGWIHTLLNVIHNIKELRVSVKDVLQGLKSVKALCNSHELLRILIKSTRNHLKTWNRLPSNCTWGSHLKAFRTANRFGWENKDKQQTIGSSPETIELRAKKSEEWLEIFEDIHNNRTWIVCCLRPWRDCGLLFPFPNRSSRFHLSRKPDVTKQTIMSEFVAVCNRILKPDSESLVCKQNNGD